MSVIFFLIGLFAFVNGDCQFQTDYSNKLGEKLKERGVYNHIYTVQRGTSTYSIGICTVPISSHHNAAIIQEENGTTYALGQLDQVNLAGGDDWMLLTYGNGTPYSNACGNKTRSASIIFVCGNKTNATNIIQEHTDSNKECDYVFEFQGFGMCPIIPVQKKHLSGGAIFLIICLCLASAYLIGGFLFMRLKRGARGLDQIPHLEMWIRLGNFAADGCDYCCRCRRHTPRAGYFLDESAPDVRDDDILAP